MVAKSGKRGERVVGGCRLGSRGSGSSGKRFVGGYRLGSLAEAMEARGVGSCRIGKSTICSTA